MEPITFGSSLAVNNHFILLSSIDVWKSVIVEVPEEIVLI